MDTFTDNYSPIDYIYNPPTQNLPSNVDPKVNMLYIIAMHSLQFSNENNITSINNLINWIKNNLPLLDEIKNHPQYNEWMNAIHHANIPINDGMFLSRYFLFKYYDYRV
jgi:hypothetical protein